MLIKHTIQSPRERSSDVLHVLLVQVLSGCIAELTRLGACDVVDSQKDDAKMSHRDEAGKFA